MKCKSEPWCECGPCVPQEMPPSATQLAQAQLDLQASIDALDRQASLLRGVVEHLASSLVEAIGRQARDLERVTSRLERAISTAIATAGRDLDGVTGTLRAAVEAAVAEQAATAAQMVPPPAQVDDTDSVPSDLSVPTRPVDQAPMPTPTPTPVPAPRPGMADQPAEKKPAEQACAPVLLCLRTMLSELSPYWQLAEAESEERQRNPRPIYIPTYPTYTAGEPAVDLQLPVVAGETPLID